MGLTTSYTKIKCSGKLFLSGSLKPEVTSNDIFFTIWSDNHLILNETNKMMYFKEQFQFCVDTNECETGQMNCSYECVNTIGSAYCACPEGYQIAEDGFSCEGKIHYFFV